MSEFFNADGEPMMDGVSMMREGYYHDEYDVDDFYYDRIGGGWEPEPEDPATCTHGDGSFPEGAGFDCDNCESLLQGPRTKPNEDDYWGTGDFFSRFSD